ncbi:Probable phospholipid-transporting ATPase IA (ATPase class I type 8A member 1) (Chromaffin granule ATPase II), partial [Durusdinium trenchii]
MYLGETTDLYVGTIRAFSTLGLLVMMMAVTAAVALYDDIQRGRADKEINMSIATVLVEGREVEKKFKDLQVGDILIVKKEWQSSRLAEKEDVGVIVYTGNDTRMVKNSRPAPMKQSNLEITTNKAMFIVLFAQTLISLTCGFLHIQFKPKHHWYLEEERIILPEWLAWWLTFFTLFSNLMPISLYPTVEFCNAFQCRAIRLDEKMHYKFPDSNELFEARTRSTNLSQELGQVGYVFSDKTGTLTQNDMILRRLSIGGKKYGTFSSGPSFAKADRSSNRSIDRFLEILAVTGQNQEIRIYEAESPDEYALVKAAAVAGFEFKSRTSESTIRFPRRVSRSSLGACTITNPDVTYSLLATNEFNSARKRMSVLVKK